MHPEPHFTRGAFTLRRARAADVAAVRAFNVRDREHQAPSSPRRPPDFESDSFWAERIAYAERDFECDRGCKMHIFDGQGRAVGQVSLTNFVRGALQACSTRSRTMPGGSSLGKSTCSIR